MSTITLFRYGPEALEFSKFLKERGHTVKWSDTDRTSIDGVPRSVDEAARAALDELWQEYVEAHSQ